MAHPGTGRLLTFGRDFAHPLGGAAWLGTNGIPDLTAPVHTWITARMAHVHCLADLLGVPGSGALADTALAGLPRCTVGIACLCFPDAANDLGRASSVE